ncbi:hypothetical protein BEP19_13395 [Ammoniphilus oxalaticus]|uniref:Sporulation protein n=1 Tax=Ammoniphilus oxalaticus TaxID=66863 RepID=A0A419SF13_9BACL|nr:YhcN/YlaJ family sporulation lipoprotein [Ammoniphilus oxalaticus]RKD22063.1 hypothetical protein BEP19_13395 [Ammoniphilus oxalaticus]
MSKNLKPLTKMLLIPTLVVGALSACGYNNDGARTNNYDGMRPYTYDNTNRYNDSAYNNSYNGVRSYNNDGARTNMFDGRTHSYDTRNNNTNNGMSPFGYGYNNGMRNDLNDGVNRNTTGFNRNATGGVTNHNHDQRLARTAAKEARSVANVTKATAIANGNDIVIGIDVKQGADRNKVEQNVRQKVKANQSGYNIHVTSDSKIHSRIHNVSTRMANGMNDMTNNMSNNNNNNSGHPVRALGNDVADIIRDIGRTVTAPFR